jgi:membrane-bound metal-dependent hydrolase YbcI (DUF457 family)
MRTGKYKTGSRRGIHNRNGWLIVPFTPFHFGPALLFGLALATLFHLPTLLVASVVPDLEPFVVLYFRVYNYPVHGFLHSYIGSSILAVLVAVCIFPLRNMLDRHMRVFRISQKSSFRTILLTAFAGVYSHVFLDSFLYSEMKPFYPLEGNPFLSVLDAFGSYSVVYGFCGLAFLFGLALYVWRAAKEFRT